MKRIIIVIIMFVSANYILFADNDKCIRCHNSSTLSVIEEGTGTLRSFHVNTVEFENSTHKNLKCTDCHTGGFEKWPHSDTLSSSMRCTNCHDKNSAFINNNPVLKEKVKSIDAEKIFEEFELSVHSELHDGKFTCFSCHNPHSFNKNNIPSADKIKYDNNMCLNCHNSDFAEGSLKNIKMPPLEITHNWLPNAPLHWESVRCIDCHTSYEGNNLSHKILPKEEAVKKCESCHSQNSVLMSKLYKHTHKESIEKKGFTNGILLSNAYVIGSTRNILLDNLSVIFFITVIAGIFTHGFFRWKTKKNNKSINKKG